MAVPRTAWVFLWVLRALHSTRGQLTECTAQTLGAQCFLSEQDVSVGCGTATDVGVCSRDAGFSCSLGDQSVPSTGDVCYEPGACWCRSGVCINRGGSDLCGFTPAITRACTPEDAKAPCFLSERDVSAGCGSDTDIGSCEPFTSDDDVVCALVETLVVPESATNGNVCHEPDGCACFSGLCLNNVPDGLCAFTSVCADGTDMCDDPHMKGLRGQRIDWSGVDGGWYSMIRDDNAHLQVNVRLTAPLPEDFPDRQLITGLSVLSEGHSFVVEVKNPYDIHTNGCPPGISPCLADGGLRAVVDGVEADDLLRFSKDAYAADGLIVSASNLPTECRQFGGDKIWARMYDEMLQGTRQLGPEETFEDWIMRFEDMAAPNWCAQYIDQHDLADLQSVYAVFKIVTSSVTVRLNVGPNTQGGGDLDWDGRILPDMEFWQMDVGLHGLSLENESLSGILGETARPVLDEHGREVMEGFDAFRGTVQDYRVSGPLGTDFGLLHL